MIVSDDYSVNITTQREMTATFIVFFLSFLPFKTTIHLQIFFRLKKQGLRPCRVFPFLASLGEEGAGIYAARAKKKKEKKNHFLTVWFP